MTARLALALLFIVPAALAYPWRTVTERWVLGIAIAVVIVVFAWWRGQFLTTLLARRLAIWRRNARGAVELAEPADRVTVVVRIESSGPDEVPVELIAGYVDRYGLRCDKVRITARDADGRRDLWVGLTLAAADNLAALQARSSQIPLRDTANIVGRRLADHLRESGWTVVIEDRDVPLHGEAKESWRALADDAGYLAVYGIPAPALPELLAEVWAHPSAETWTAVEFGSRTAAAVWAVRTPEAPGPGVPVPGLTRLGGRQRPAIDALALHATQRLDGHTPAGSELAGRLTWPACTPAAPVRT